MTRRHDPDTAFDNADDVLAWLAEELERIAKGDLPIGLLLVSPHRLEHLVECPMTAAAAREVAKRLSS